MYSISLKYEMATFSSLSGQDENSSDIHTNVIKSLVQYDVMDTVTIQQSPVMLVDFSHKCYPEGFQQIAIRVRRGNQI